MQTHSSPNHQHIVPESHSTQGVKPSPSLTLEVEVLEERIAPAYFGGFKPVDPCCAGR